jgi:hypothetical protein
MPKIEFSTHAKNMLKERNILEEWVWRTINTPDRKRRGDDYNMHYTKPIKEYEGRVLHVVVNQDVQPNRIVTVFFDRRLWKKARRTK